MAAITKKPNKTVTGLGAPVRQSGSRRMTASWKVPSSMTKSSSNRRATSLVVAWKLDIGGIAKKLSKSYATSKSSASINLSSFKIGRTNYTRSSFYPKTDKLLSSVSISVTGKNSKGKGKAVTQTRKFTKPRKPEIDFITFNTANGHCVTTIKTDSGMDYAERYDTMYRVTVTNPDGETFVPATGVTVTSGTQQYTEAEKALQSTEFTVEYDVGSYQSLADDEYIKVVISAWARGFAGDSAGAEANAKEYYISKPLKATIEKHTVTSKDSTGQLVVSINTNQTVEHPVDTVRLEYLRNVTYENATDIPSDADWEDSGIEDNGDCTALTMPLGNRIPDRGKYTWIRVKSFHANEAVLYTYSDYTRLTDLETPPAETAESGISILSAVSGADGQSAVVLLGWNVSGTDDSTGTELTWSDEEDTWKSTKEPESHEFTWSDGAITHDGVTYNDSAEIVIKGLSEGEKYYIRARRYYEGETTSYGRYSNTATVITSEKPAGVVANCDRFVTAGEPLPIYWTFSGNGMQTDWQIVDSNGTIVVNGEGSRGATQISADRLATFAVDNSVTLTVQVSTGSGFVSSEPRTVTILERPTLEITAPTTLTAQPFSFTATSDRLCDLIVIVSAQGTSGQYPEGVRVQTAGDTIHSGVYSPAWENGSTTVTLPDGLDFLDLGSYTLSVVAIDRETKLRSEPPIEAGFTVEWAHQAVDPDEAVTLTPLDYTTDGGEHIQAVQIELTPPTGSSEDDVYDIYRMDGGNAHLIGAGFPLTFTAVDEYAPFGDNEELYYRIALRTADGDVEFADKEYELVSDTIRFDWQGGTLELPYGVSIGDSYSKNVEFRQHMDGSVDGYWNQNIDRKGSYSSSVIKLIQPDEINLARQLARYAGAVFVRTANGSAYTADVQVTDLSVKNKAVTLIAVDATEVGLTEEFMLPTPYEQEDE